MSDLRLLKNEMSTVFFLFINTLVFENKLLKFKLNIVCADAGYANCLIAHFVQYHNCNLLVPYVRPKGKKSEFGKHKFYYYFEIDQYMCPNHKMLVRGIFLKQVTLNIKFINLIVENVHLEISV